MKLCDFFKICPLVSEDKCISQDGRDEQSCIKYWEHQEALRQKKKALELEELIESWR